MAISKLGALVVAMPGEAARIILRALDRAAGSRKRAAVLLNVPAKGLYNYIHTLGLWADIDELIRRRGYVDPYATSAAVRSPVRELRYGHLLPKAVSVAALPPRRHSPIRFDLFDLRLADEAEGWKSFP